jgi:hypothetical protein
MRKKRHSEINRIRFRQIVSVWTHKHNLLPQLIKVNRTAHNLKDLLTHDMSNKDLHNHEMKLNLNTILGLRQADQTKVALIKLSPQLNPKLVCLSRSLYQVPLNLPLLQNELMIAPPSSQIQFNPILQIAKTRRKKEKVPAQTGAKI